MSELVGTSFRVVVIAGALAASAYAMTVPLTARSGENAEMRYLASTGLMFPGLYPPLSSLSPVCWALTREAPWARQASSPN